MIEHVYHAAYYKIEDGWFLVKLLDFPGTITQGRTLKEARFMIKDALKLMAECIVDRGEPLPKPNPKATDKKAELVEPIRLKTRFFAKVAK